MPDKSRSGPGHVRPSTSDWSLPAALPPSDATFALRADQARSPSRGRSSATGRDDGAVIGRLEKTVLDCPEPRDLAAFYGALLGMNVNEDNGDWVVIGIDPGDRHLAFQRSPAYVPPRWPDPTSS